MIFNNSSVDGADRKARAGRSPLWVTVISMLAAGIVTLLVVFGIQNHQDHLLTAQMIQTETDLKTTGARIADIKDRKVDSMTDYINAYAHIEPLLDEYNRELHQIR